MFHKILIANRGEIAVRILRTAKRLAINTVIVYSSVDRHSLAVSLADEAYEIGDAAAKNSYLNSAKILAIAQQTGAEAIHPGYGFLAENADFAEACQQAGIVFIGPSANSIRQMGLKNASKALLMPHQIPCVPGYHGDDQTLDTLRAEAKRIGYPLLIKAAAGGGGKGMRIVREEAALATEIASAKREALASFGDDQILLEKYLSHARHIEMQIFADSQGNVVHLFERDCSMQRRYQKVIEESPALHLSADLLQRLQHAATTVAKIIQYVGAGTIEFIVDHDDFYFMEMNTRLQVEHPVTEMITGLDLVEWQLRVASGETLPLTQAEIKRNGHAIEVRVCAEDPENGFLPAIGQCHYLHFPAPSATLRIDTGIRQGDTISPYYDSMVAKIISYGADREIARRSLINALIDCHVVGVKTNRNFLLQLLKNPVFIAGLHDTAFIGREITVSAEQLSADILKNLLLAASIYKLMPSEQHGAVLASTDNYSPWSAFATRNLAHYSAQELAWCDEQHQLHRVNYQLPAWAAATLTLTLLAKINSATDFDNIQARLLHDHGKAKIILMTMNNHSWQVSVWQDPASARIHVFQQEFHASFCLNTLARDEQPQHSDNQCKSPMPGAVVAIHVEAQQVIKRGAPLLTLEAMKMEHTLKSPCDATVKAVHYRVGDQVNAGVELLSLEPIHV